MSKPVIILVAPQMGENIGAAARVMANFNLSDLRIVTPRDGWPNPAAEAMSAGGIEIIKNAKIFSSLEDAVADVNYLLACSARRRDMDKEHISSKGCLNNITGKVGIMFGRENNGLSNEEVTLADKIVSVPVSEDYPSLNLAQAVSIICYEWFSESNDKKVNEKSVATKDEMVKLFEHLEEELDKKNFFKVETKKTKMVRNIRNMLSRSQLSSQEVQTFRGIISSLTQKQ